MNTPLNLDRTTSELVDARTKGYPLGAAAMPLSAIGDLPAPHGKTTMATG